MQQQLQVLSEQELLQNSNPPDEYVFSCVQGMQANDFFWMGTISFQQAKSLFYPFFNRGKEAPQDLAQRTLDTGRAKKIADYIVKALAGRGFYILLPIVVTLDIPEGEEYEFQEIDFGEGFEQFTNNGLLRLPGSTQFFIPDGQHRAYGILISILAAFGLIQQESIGVMFIPDPGGKKRKQIFLDANQHGLKPNKSIIALFDHRDEYSDIARKILTTVPVFCDRTALEATNVSPKSVDFFTLNALKDSCKVLLAGYEGDREKRAIQFWERIAKHHPDWKHLETLNQADALQLRFQKLSFNAITLNALALVGKLQPDDQWINRLHQVDWSVSNPDLNGVCYFNGRIVKNNTTIKALTSYIQDKTS